MNNKALMIILAIAAAGGLFIYQIFSTKPDLEVVESDAKPVETLDSAEIIKDVKAILTRTSPDTLPLTTSDNSDTSNPFKNLE